MSKWHYLGIATTILRLSVTFEEGFCLNSLEVAFIEAVSHNYNFTGGGSGSILRQNSLRVNYNKYHSAPSSAPARSHSSEKYER